MTAFTIAAIAAVLLSAIAIAVVSDQKVAQRRYAFAPILAVAVFVLGGLAPAAQAAEISPLLAVTRDAGQSIETLDDGMTQTSKGGQYQGLEYPNAKGTPLSDSEITRRIQADAPGTLVMSVSNGSVRLSGNVSDRKTAEGIVATVKALPGVHEVAYDIGLDK
ncbi:BON domain-containing protein [Vacuolonema iberomarrocanum]|uniref:BON domain-containing protein n=1 Tax=Vacuolonema iberomarrocanum TaxID=3454632 RepID=UPI0019FBC637|nr:BON domain-containing protein [filamentous cyanobacterium LEGE 07170]